jgi:hypothetical protein
MPWRTLPPLEDIEYTDVLTNYGQTMLYVQAFEHTLKSILLFHRVIEEPSAEPMDDKGVRELLEGGPKTLGPALTKVLSIWKKLGMSAFPATGEECLLLMVTLRNRLAHSYLIENSRLFKSAEGRRLVIAELRWYSQVFRSMAATMEPWVHSLIRALGETPNQVEIDYGPVIEHAMLEALRANLTGIGISLPDPPRSQA